eukprot:jgi/Tetstr1/425312/TSEL_015762.t1
MWWASGASAARLSYRLGCRGRTAPQHGACCASCLTKPDAALYAVNKRCVCGKYIPSMGLLGEGRATERWCASCPTKPETTVNVVSKRCECGKTQPMLGLLGEGRATERWCASCPTKPEAAVNVVRKRRRAP